MLVDEWELNPVHDQFTVSLTWMATVEGEKKLSPTLTATVAARLRDTKPTAKKNKPTRTDRGERGAETHLIMLNTNVILP